MITVVIPALNESARIQEVVKLAHRSKAVDEVIVVDDGSLDNTAEIAAAAGARVKWDSKALRLRIVCDRGD